MFNLNDFETTLRASHAAKQSSVAEALVSPGTQIRAVVADALVNTMMGCYLTQRVTWTLNGHRISRTKLEKLVASLA